MRVLLVEDNPGDVGLVIEGMSTAPVPVELDVATDGVEAMEILRRHPSPGVAGGPHLVILDLNLPRRDGRQVLREIRSDAVWRRIPVVVLTSSDAESDVASSYELGANCYLTKPLDLSAYLGMVHSIAGFWLRLVCLPVVPLEPASAADQTSDRGA